MALHPARLLWIVAIAAVAFALAATLGVALYRGRGLSLEEWTEKLMPPGGRVLHAETRDGHHLIAFHAPESKLRVCVVHPAHPLARWYGVTGFVQPIAGGATITPDVPHKLASAQVEHMEYTIPSGLVGDLTVCTVEFGRDYVPGDDPGMQF